jgi:hypothetical protein
MEKNQKLLDGWRNWTIKFRMKSCQSWINLNKTVKQTKI